jgi:hypothetical protein
MLDDLFWRATQCPSSFVRFLRRIEGGAGSTLLERLKPVFVGLLALSFFGVSRSSCTMAGGTAEGRNKVALRRTGGAFAERKRLIFLEFVAAPFPTFFPFVPGC